MLMSADRRDAWVQRGGDISRAGSAICYCLFRHARHLLVVREIRRALLPYHSAYSGRPGRLGPHDLNPEHGSSVFQSDLALYWTLCRAEREIPYH